MPAVEASQSVGFCYGSPSRLIRWESNHCIDSKSLNDVGQRQANTAFQVRERWACILTPPIPSCMTLDQSVTLALENGVKSFWRGRSLGLLRFH